MRNKQGSLKRVRICLDTPSACLQLYASQVTHAQIQSWPFSRHINKMKRPVSDEDVSLFVSGMLKQWNDQGTKGERNFMHLFFCDQRLHAVAADRSHRMHHAQSISLSLCNVTLQREHIVQCFHHHIRSAGLPSCCVWLARCSLILQRLRDPQVFLVLGKHEKNSPKSEQSLACPLLWEW